MKEIPLSQGKFALIDDEDFELVSKYKWHISKKGYARTEPGKKKKINTAIPLHRLIMNAPAGVMVDHKDLDKLNNQKSNLRIATFTQNNRNVGIRKDNTSGFKGVLWNRKSGKWQARIRVDKKQIHLGFSNNIILVAKMYNEGAKKYFGEYAYLNKF